MPYKHVLAAVDLSDESAQILERAQATADSDGAKLSLISVVKSPTHVYGGLDLAPLSSALSIEETLAQATEQLQEIARIYRVDSADVHVKLGVPAREIRDAASEWEADLIVMGTHGRHGLGLLLGSTTNSVLHGVGCDVLAVRVKVSQ